MDIFCLAQSYISTETLQPLSFQYAVRTEVDNITEYLKLTTNSKIALLQRMHGVQIRNQICVASIRQGTSLGAMRILFQ